MVDRIGQQLGSYRLLRLLGRGGFAEVYLGEHVRLPNHAAVKVLNTSVAEDEVQNFQREAHTIGALLHPHIIRVFDYDITEGVPFLIMDYAPNGTIRNPYPRGKRVPLPTVISYVKQIAAALQYAHAQRVIHRDIKPENMLLGRDHEVLLSDFGIATMSQSSRYQKTQDIVGTVSYMAPEQIQGKPHPASDQYALAIVVYEWLAGERPFKGSFTEIVAQHAVMPPPPLHAKVPGIAPAVEEVIRTALAKDLHQRFGSIQAFANALEQAAALSPLLGNDAPTQTAISSAPTAVTPLPETILAPTPPVPDPPVPMPGAHNTGAPIPIASHSSTLAPPQHKSTFSRRVLLTTCAALAIAGSSAAVVIAYNNTHASPSRNVPTQTTGTEKAQASITPMGSPTETPTSPPTQLPFSGSWFAAPALPYPTADNAATYVQLQQQEYIYMTGGYRGTRYSPPNDDTLYRYVIAASRWESVTSNFPGMYNSSVVQDEQQNIYFTGGYSPDNQTVITCLYKYQPATGALQQIIPPGQIVFGYGGSMLADQNGHLYLTQGFMQVYGTYTPAGNGWYRYDIAQNQWETLAPLPANVAYAVLAFDSQKNVVLMGGVTDTEQTNGTSGIYRYASALNRWTTEQTKTPQPFNGAASCSVGNGQVIVIGGYDPANNVTLSTVWLIDLNTLSIRSLASLPGGGARLGTASCDKAGNVYVTRGILDNPDAPTADFLRLSQYPQK